MNEANALIVGMDLGNEATQLSYYNYKTFEADSVFTNKELQEYRIPTALAVTENTKDWLFGEEAVECGLQNAGIMLRNFLYYDQEIVTIYGKEFTRVYLYEKFLRKVLMLLKKEFPNKSISRLTVTIKRPDARLVRELYEAFSGLGIYEDRVRIISYEQSYLNYALSRKKELWMNDVGLFDYDDEGLTYYQISIDRRTRPMLVGVQKKDFCEMLSYKLVWEHNPNLGYMFDNIAASVLHKQIISTLYMTGKGFAESWVKPSLQNLCNGRRVFIGQNLYCYGACYEAKKEMDTEHEEQFAFISNETLSFSVGMRLFTGGSIKEMLLVEAATPWYEVNNNFQVILDGENELQFIIHDIIRKTSQTRIIALDDFAGRMDRGTRLEIRLRCTDNHSLVVTVKDLGFGEFYPTTNRIWEKIIAM